MAKISCVCSAAIIRCLRPVAEEGQLCFTCAMIHPPKRRQLPRSQHEQSFGFDFFAPEPLHRHYGNSAPPRPDLKAPEYWRQWSPRDRAYVLPDPPAPELFEDELDALIMEDFR